MTNYLERLTLRIDLPADRDYVGLLRVLDSCDHLLAGPCRIAARASDEIAAQHGNPTRASTLAYGDPPLGSYRVRGLASTGAGTKYRSDLFGHLDVIILNGTAGYAALADANGRFEVLIHGGPLSATGGLRATTGHFRISDPDLSVLSDLIRRAKTAWCVCDAAPSSDGVDLVSDLGRVPETRSRAHRARRASRDDQYLVAYGEYNPYGSPVLPGTDQALSESGAQTAQPDTTSLTSPSLPQPGAPNPGMESISQSLRDFAVQSGMADMNPYSGMLNSPALLADASGTMAAPYYPVGQPANTYNATNTSAPPSGQPNAPASPPSAPAPGGQSDKPGSVPMAQLVQNFANQETAGPYNQWTVPNSDQITLSLDPIDPSWTQDPFFNLQPPSLQPTGTSGPQWKAYFQRLQNPSPGTYIDIFDNRGGTQYFNPNATSLLEAQLLGSQWPLSWDQRLQLTDPGDFHLMQTAGMGVLKAIPFVGTAITLNDPNAGLFAKGASVLGVVPYVGRLGSLTLDGVSAVLEGLSAAAPAGESALASTGWNIVVQGDRAIVVLGEGAPSFGYSGAAGLPTSELPQLATSELGATPNIIDTQTLIQAADRGNASALAAIRSGEPVVTMSQLREFLDVTTEVQQTQRAQFLLDEGITPLSTSYGQLNTPQLSNIFSQIAFQQGQGTADAALIIHGLQSGFPIITNDVTLVRTIWMTLNPPLQGVTIIPVRF